MYICTKCIKGDCVRYRDGDTKNKKAYKCNLCGKIQYHNRESETKIISRIENLELKINDIKKQIKEQEKKVHDCYHRYQRKKQNP